MEDRYLELVQRHLDAVPSGAAGCASMPSACSAFADTMGAWRFFNNPRISFAELIEPLRESARQALAATGAPVVMLVHDWCKLSDPGHTTKQDQAELSQGDNRGYELTTVLAVDGSNGAPLAPLEVHFKTADGLLSTRESEPANVHHLDQVLPTMNASRGWKLTGAALHVIDREADSVGHYRAWHAAGHHFLVRGQDHRVVTWEGRKLARRSVSEELAKRGAFQHSGPVLSQGVAADLWVAETEVVLAQPARTMVIVGRGKNAKKKQRQIAGEALTMRMIVAKVCDAEGNVLATWHLLSNAPMELLTAKQLAQCYYWRWRIESYFKLLKSHGQQLEHWRQETGAAIFRRLLVATMACVTVWHLLADTSLAAIELKDILIRLSGRQMKRTVPYTAPALLAGLWSLLSLLEYLETHELSDLKKLVQSVSLPVPIRRTG